MGFASSPSNAFYSGSAPDPQQPTLSAPTLLRSQSSFQQNLVDVPISPAATDGEHHVHRQLRLDIESDISLSLLPVPSRPPWLSRLTYITFLGCLVIMIYYAVQGVVLGIERQKNDSVIMWSCFAIIPALIILGTLIYPFFKSGPLQYRFDRQSRLMTVQRCYGISKMPRLIATFSLDDVVALQLLNRYYKVAQAGIPINKFKNVSYEMNLVFRNTHPPRVNLAVHGDWRWMQQAGMRLAEFLEITVLDQMCQS